MDTHRIVDHAQWQLERRQLLEREKDFTRQRDALARERQALPWEPVERTYEFIGAQGKVGFDALFEGRGQLLVYHFMYAPEWDIGCKSCSFWADQFDAIIPHLRQRDVTLAAVSRAPLEKLAAQARRFGWHFPWYSAVGEAFNQDFQVSFSDTQLASGSVDYNYEARQTKMTDLPGISAFIRDGGRIHHTYSAYSRGLDALNAAYQFLDIAPKGRDEAGLPYPMAWIRHRIAYDT